MNLIHNAVQAMGSTPGIERALRISTEVGPLEVSVTVVDSGPGIPPEVIENYFRGHSSPTKPDGLGVTGDQSFHHRTASRTHLEREP